MTEKSIPINFTVECLEKPLKQKQVTATIRGGNYISKYGLKAGEKIEIKYKRKRIGFAVIKDIYLIGYHDLFDPEIVRKEGFDSSDELISVLKQFWKWHWNNIVDGKQKIPIIEFEWI